MSGLGRYVDRGSFIHKLDPRTKIAITICIIIMALMFTHPIFLAAWFFTFVLVFRLAGKLKFSEILTPLKVLVFFILLIILINGFFLFKTYTVNGKVVHGYTLFEIFGVSFTFEGVLQGVGFGFRIATSAMAVYCLLSLATPTNALARALVKTKIPYRWAYYFTAVIRFIPLMGENLNDIIDSQMGRGMRPTRNYFKLFFPVVIPLFINMMLKATQTSLAVTARGFNPKSSNRTYIVDIKMQRRDYVVTIGMIVTTIVLAYFAYTMGFGYWLRAPYG